MNEELRIIIRAVTNEAERALQGVRDALNDINEAAEETKLVDQALQAVGKGAMAAVGGIVALTTAMVTLGKSSLEFQKIQGQLVSGFQSVGLSAQQAGEVYKNLFSFLGEADTAAEAANLLAQLTQEEANLTEWTQILMGVYAKFPDSLPVESLAEAVNHTAQLGEVQGTLADALEWSGVNVESFNNQLAATSNVSEREALIRGTLNSLYMTSARLYAQNNQALMAYHQSQVAVDQALADATAYVIPLMSALNNLAATLLSVLKPAFENISAVLVAFIQWVIAAIKAVGAFFGVFSSKGTTSTKTISATMGAVSTKTTQVASGVNKIGKAFDGATKSAEKLKRQTMGFDELNVLSPQHTVSSGGSSGGGGGSIEIPEVEIPDVSIPGLSNINLPGLDEFEEKVSKIKEYLDAIAVLIGIVGIGLLGWKIADFISDVRLLYLTMGEVKEILGPGWSDKIEEANYRVSKFQEKLVTVAGVVMLVAGAFMTVKGFADILVNGLDWGNFTTLVAGLAVALGGLALVIRQVDAAAKQLAMGIGVVVAGIVLMVAGVMDFVKNGPSVQNTILIIGGAIAVAVGLATAGLSVLVSAIIAAVAAVAAFTAAILLEEPAIMTVEEAQENLTAAKNRAIEAENGYINAVDAADAALQRLTAAEEAAGMTGEELYKQVQQGTIDYQDMDAAQRELYKAYIDNEQKQKDLKASTEEFNKAKKAETLASYEHQLALAKESGNYDDFKASVVAAYEAGELSADEAREMIEKSMSEMSDASQKTFMEDLPGDLKSGLDPHRYESTGTKLKKWFSNLWTGIKNVFADVKTWFADIGTKIGTALSNAAASAINWVLEKAIGIINGFIKSINWALDIINAIPGVNISKLSLLSVPKLATGGITTGATMAMIGERGREAVLPLENNTGWMDILADRIATKNNTPSRIVLMLDGKELGYATINSINGITRQTGALQLKLI